MKYIIGGTRTHFHRVEPNRRQFRADVRAPVTMGDRVCGNCTKFLLSKATNRTRARSRGNGYKKNRRDFLVVVKSLPLAGINRGTRSSNEREGASSNFVDSP